MNDYGIYASECCKNCDFFFEDKYLKNLSTGFCLQIYDLEKDIFLQVSSAAVCEKFSLKPNIENEKLFF